MNSLSDDNKKDDGFGKKNTSFQKIKIDRAITKDLIDDILILASENRTSDITIQPGIAVKAKIGGIFHDLTVNKLTVEQVNNILKIIYTESGVSSIARGFDIDFSYQIRRGNEDEMKKWRFRGNATNGRGYGKTNAIQITLRALPSKPKHIRELGIQEEIIENFRPEKGLVIISGPTGSGKSTLLAGGIRNIIEDEARYEKILEFSKPIEYQYDEVVSPNCIVHQTELGTDLVPNQSEYTEGELWAYAVRNTLRRAPDIGIIGEARDKATIKGCITFANTGHLCYTTMHTVGVATTINRALSEFSYEERTSIAADLVNVLRLVVTQTLEDSTNGGKVAVREYMVFEEHHRKELLSKPYEEWSGIISDWLDSDDVKGMSRKKHAKELFDQGLIDEYIYKKITF